MTLQPLAHNDRPIQYVDAIAQCQMCKQTSSYDAVDAYEQRPLECPCGGRLKLYSQVTNGDSANATQPL